jgi:hypothetical protein
VWSSSSETCGEGGNRDKSRKKKCSKEQKESKGRSVSFYFRLLINTSFLPPHTATAVATRFLSSNRYIPQAAPHESSVRAKTREVNEKEKGRKDW